MASPQRLADAFTVDFARRQIVVVETHAVPFAVQQVIDAFGERALGRAWVYAIYLILLIFLIVYHVWQCPAVLLHAARQM